MGQVYFKLMRLGTFQTIEKRPAIRCPLDKLTQGV